MSLNPWLVLLLGILIGWILEWLLELFFFRRRRLECQRQLAEVETQLRTRDDELRQAQARIAVLETELAGRSGAVASADIIVVAPAVAVEAPEAEESGAGVGAVGLAAAGLAGAVVASAVDDGPEAEVEAATAIAETPEVEGGGSGIGAVGLAAAGLTGAVVASAASKKPAAETAAPQMPSTAAVAVAAPLPEVALYAEPPESELPSVELDVPYVNAVVQTPDGAATHPPLELGAPSAEKGVSGIAAAAVAAGVAGIVVGKKLVERPAAEVDAPPVEAAEVAVELPGAAVAAGIAAGVAGEPAAEAEAPLGEAKATSDSIEATHKGGAVALATGAAALGAVVGQHMAGQPAAEVDAPPVEAAEVAVELPGVAGAAGVAAAMGADAFAEEKADGTKAAALVAGAPTQTAKDDLTLIRGIGPKFAAQLAAAGITTFAALAAASPEQLQEATDAPTWQKPDYAGWIAEAKVWEKQRGTLGDDLLIIEGIGPVYAAKLRGAGITTFAQLAEADDGRLSEIIQAPAWRKVNYGDWREQARLAAAGDAASLKTLQDKLFARDEKDNLALIAGIGDKTATALQAAGIASFAALAATPPEQLDKTVKLTGLPAGDYDAWIAEAKVRAAGERVVRAPKPESCPQDLSRVEGIGEAYETKLYEAGIGAYWQLSILTNEELAYILNIQDFQKVDLSGIRADASRLAQETNTLERIWDATPPDDLELVEGIGATYEGRLYDAGICTFEALAAATPERLAEICKAPAFAMPDYASWIAQAGKFIGKRARGVKHLVPCPQDLSAVEGIGSAYETRLYEAGIGSYWELAQADEAELRRILEIKDFQQVDLAALKADAQRLADETATVGRGWTGVAPDDFEEIEGIGSTYEGRLYAAGVCTFKALSYATVEQLADICKAPAFRTPNYLSWIAQAKVLIAQRGR